MSPLDLIFPRLIRSGPLTVIDAQGRRKSYGAPTPGVKPLTIRLTGAATPWRILINPALGFGEAYMDGRLTIEDGDIRDLADLIGYNIRWDAGNPVRSRGWRPGRLATPLDSWKKWATDVRGSPVDSGHFLTEENPDATARALKEFFAAG